MSSVKIIGLCFSACPLWLISLWNAQLLISKSLCYDVYTLQSLEHNISHCFVSRVIAQSLHCCRNKSHFYYDSFLILSIVSKYRAKHSWLFWSQNVALSTFHGSHRAESGSTISAGMFDSKAQFSSSSSS